MSGLPDAVRRLYQKIGYRGAVLLHIVIAQMLAMVCALVGSWYLKGRIDRDIVVLAAVIPLVLVLIHSVLDLRLLFQLEHSEQSLLQIAVRDSLTGAYTRQHLLARAQHEVERAWRRPSPLALLVVDIDRFKQINDNHGHAVGDTVLISFVRKCRNVIRHVDLLGRLGGDEFVLVLPECTKEQALRAAERIRKFASDRDTGKGVSYTLSIGVAVLSPEVNNLENLIHAADQALFVAKQAGRDRSHLAGADQGAA
jgi:diguanylate cyclase (GGDEF)-like protein